MRGAEIFLMCNNSVGSLSVVDSLVDSPRRVRIVQRRSNSLIGNLSIAKPCRVRDMVMYAYLLLLLFDLRRVKRRAKGKKGI